MNETIHAILLRVYAAFNKKDADTALSFMHPDIHWPNAWEGGYLNGHEAVRNYWTRQWKELDPYVVPISFIITPDNRIETGVHQVVKDTQGNLLVDTIITHIYSFEDGLIRSMEIKTGTH